MTGFPMEGIVLVGVTWDGKRLHLNEMDEWGGFLTADEGVHWATEQITKYTQWTRYEKIEVHDFKRGKGNTLVVTLDSQALVPGIDMSDKRRT